MKKDKMITLRVDEALLRNIDETHANLNGYLGCDVSPSYMMRMLLSLGIASYNQSYMG